MNRRVVLWIVSSCTILCLGAGIIIFLLGSKFVEWANQKPEDIEVDVTAPTSVALDEDFILVVEITNLANKEQLLDSLDIDLSYLEGFIVTRTEPAHVDFSDFGREYHTYEFDFHIPIGQTLEVSYFLTAAKVGDYSGEIGICINSYLNCTDRFIRTIVKE